MNFNEMSDAAVLREIGGRIKQERLNQNRTQTEIASTARIGLNVVKRLENGAGCTLGSLIRVLRALSKIEQLDNFLPEPGVSPLELARLAGRKRKEASGNRGRRLNRKSGGDGS